MRSKTDKSASAESWRRMRNRDFRKMSTVAMFLLLLAGIEPPSWASSTFERDEFQAQYRQILQTCASGKPEDALEALVELESAALGGYGADGAERVWQAEAGILEDILNTTPDAIWPILLFHEQAFIVYNERGLFESSAYSLLMTVNIVDAYVEKVNSEEGRLAAALLLTDLSYHTSQFATSMSLLLKALDLAPSHEAPLLGLAKFFEIRGKYEEARTYLQRLVEAHNENGEAKLRLAINLDRFGRRSEAKELFQQLLKSAAPSWVRSLSYQELARILTEDGELEPAASLLEQGGQELPSDFTLLVYLAYLTDRAGRPRESSLAASMEKCTKDCDASPRAIYLQRTGPAHVRLHEQLQNQSASNSELLSRALLPASP